jgi:type VI secretion system protein VasD
MTGGMMKRRTAIAGLLALGACAGPPPPASVTLNVAAGADQNPDQSGRPSPVAVQVFFLKGTARFERADWTQLTERERDTLGPDSGGSEQFVFGPGERRSITRELQAGVQAIGVVALFRNNDTGARWRAFAAIAPSGASALAMTIGRNSVTLAAGG